MLLCVAVLYGKFRRKASIAATSNAIVVQPQQVVVAAEPVAGTAGEPVMAIPVAIQLASGIPVAEPMVFPAFSREIEMYQLQSGPRYGASGPWTRNGRAVTPDLDQSAQLRRATRGNTPQPHTGMPSRPSTAEDSGRQYEASKQDDLPRTAESPRGKMPGAVDAQSGTKSPEAMKQADRPGTADWCPGNMSSRPGTAGASGRSTRFGNFVSLSSRPDTADSQPGTRGNRIHQSSEGNRSGMQENSAPGAPTDHEFYAITPAARWVPDSES